MTDVQSQVTSNASSVAQWAAVEALLGPQDEVRVMAAEFDRRRHLIVDGLNRLPGVSCIKPKGAFYAFANVAGLFCRSSPSAAGDNLLPGFLPLAPGIRFVARGALRAGAVLRPLPHLP